MRGRRVRTSERTLADLVEPLLKALPGKRRLQLFTVTDSGGGA